MPTKRSRLGARGEGLARDYLTRKGFNVLETNYRCQWGEVDLVAMDGDILVFVEVRTRRGGSFGTPEESLTRDKALKLLATAQTYLEEHPPEPDLWRIDLVAVEMDHRGKLLPLRHHRNVVEDPPPG